MSSGEDGLIGIPFPEHSSELLSRLNAQRRAGLLCDLTLTSRGARYPTHRSVMAAVSLYFRRLFGVDDEEGGGGGGDSAFSVCQLDCVSPDALDALLDFAYTATLTIRASNMRDVLRAAQLLGIQCVEEACRDILGEEEEEEEARGGDEEERRGGDEEKEEGGRRSHQGASYDELGTAAATAAEGREPPPTPPPPPREQGSRRKTDRTKMRRVASATGVVEQDRTAASAPPQTTVLDSSALRQQEGDEEEEEEGEGSKTVTAAGEASSAQRGLGRQRQQRRQGEEGRKRKWKSHVPQQCPVCRKVIHDARNLPRHMGTHTERSCTYLNGLGLCLSVGNVEREDRVLQTSIIGTPRVQTSMSAQTSTTGIPHVQTSMPAQTPTIGPPRVQSSMRRVASVWGVEQEDPTDAPQTTTTVLDSSTRPLQGQQQQLRPSLAPLLHCSEHNGGAATATGGGGGGGGGGGVGEGTVRSSMSVNGGTVHRHALLTQSPHRTPSTSVATLIPPPPPADAAAVPPDHLLLLKHEEEEQEEEDEEKGEGFRPATTALSPPSGEALPAEHVGMGGGGDSRKRRFPSQMPQRCPVCQKVIHGAGKLPRHMRTHAERSCTYLNGLGLCLSVGNVEQEEDSELGAPSTTSPVAYASSPPPTAAQSQTPGASPVHLPLTGTDSEGLGHKLPSNM